MFTPASPPTPSRSRPPRARRGSLLLECLVAIVLLELIGTLVLAAAQTLQWSRQLTRVTARASTLVMAASDGASLAHCPSDPAPATEPVLTTDPSGLLVRYATNATAAERQRDGQIVLPLSVMPGRTLAPADNPPRIERRWRAAWWCPQ